MAIRKMLVQEFGSDRLVASYGAVLRLENLSTPELQVAYMEHLAGRTNAELAEVGRTQNQPAYSIALTDGAKRWLRKDYLPDNGGAEALVYKYRDEVEGPLLQAIMDNKGAIPAGARFVVDAVGEDEAAHLEIRVE